MRDGHVFTRSAAALVAFAVLSTATSDVVGGNLAIPYLLSPTNVGSEKLSPPKAYQETKGGTIPFPYQILYQDIGASDTLFTGYGVCGGGDVNGDGIPDFIVSAPLASPGGVINAGMATVYSGLDGSQLYQINGTDSAQTLGTSAAIIGDINGDNRAEFLIGAMGASPGGQAGAGSVYLYSGLNGSILQQKDGLVAGDQLGASVGAAGNVNADAIPDYIIGAPYADSGSLQSAGIVYVYSGAGGGLLYRKYGAEAYDNFGQNVARAGLINNDARADFIVSAPYADSGKGVAYVYSGLNGSLLYRVTGDSTDAHLGWGANGVNGAGDVNNDGVDDFVVGAPHGDTNTGVAYVYSGLDGDLLLRVDGDESNSFMGFSVAGADVTGDGTSEVIVSAPGTMVNGALAYAGAVYVYSVATGARIHESYAPIDTAIYGYRVASTGDLNSDGKDDFIVGSPQGNYGGNLLSGAAFVLSWGATEAITNLSDVGNDQGKQMRIQWSNMPANNGFIQEFAIYRRVDGGLKSDAVDPYDLKSTPPGEWDFVKSVPARGDSVYSTVVPTLRDSTVADGMWWTAFFVSGIGENPVDHFDSPVDSGYSLDNLAPAPPAALFAAQAGPDIDLDWKSTSAADFDYYWVYRDTVPGFAVSPGKRIGSTSDTSFVDNAPPSASGVYYRVSAVDFSGNEGLPSSEASTSACACDCAHDPQCDGVSNVFDVTHVINVAFRGAATMIDPNISCPWMTTDVDCNGVTNVFDVTHLINVAFRGGNPAVEFCNPCN